MAIRLDILKTVCWSSFFPNSELIIALQKFPNGFAVVSNNVNFVRQITPQIYELTSSGKLEEFVGDIVQYDTASKQRVADKLAKLARSDW